VSGLTRPFVLLERAVHSVSVRIVAPQVEGADTGNVHALWGARLCLTLGDMWAFERILGTGTDW